MRRAAAFAPAAGSAGADHGPRRPLAEALVAAGLCALYLVTRSRIHTWDALAYAARAAGDPLLADRYFSTRLFHPHHLLHAPLALAAHRALAPLGLARDPVLPLQILSALAGTLAAWLAGRLAVRLGASEARALLVTAAVGLSNAVWRFSTEALVMVPSLACLMLSAWLAAGTRTRARWLASGVALAGALLIHQSAAVFAAGASLALLAAVRGGRARAGAALAFTLGWAVPAALAYLAVGRIETGSLSPAALARWMTTAGSRATSTHLPLAAVLRETASGLAESWVTLAPLRALRAAGAATPGAGLGALAAVIGLGGLAAAALASLGSLGRAARAGDPVVAALIAGAAANAALVAAFQPWNHAYWVFVPALAVTLIAASLPPLSRRASRAVPLVIAAVALVNLFARALPATDPARAPYADLVAFAGRHLRPGDRLVSGGVTSPIAEGIIAFPYFARVPVVLAPTPGNAEEAARFARLANEALAAGSGARVFVTADALAPLLAARPDVVPRPIGTLRGMTIYRVDRAEAASPASP